MIVQTETGCPECAYELRTGQPVPDGVAHKCDEQPEEEQHDEPEPDGGWVQAHGGWIYE